MNEPSDMVAVVITDEGGVQRRLGFTKPELTVGRVQGNDIVLAKRNVSKQHARLSIDDDQAVVTDLNSTNGTWVNGRKITAPHRLKEGDKIYIADFILTLEPEDEQRGSAAPRMSEPPPLPPKSPAPVESASPIRRSVAARRPPLESRTPAVGDIHATSLPPRIENRETDAPEAEQKTQSAIPDADPLAALLSRLADRIDLDDVDPDAMKNQERWSATRAAIAETFLAMQTDGSVPANADMGHIAHVALHEAVGLGPLDDLLSDDSVRAIVVHGHDRIFVDRGEGLRVAATTFSSPTALVRIARRLAAQSGTSLGSRPALHGRLSFGPRVTILQAPLVHDGLVIELAVARHRSHGELAEAGWLSSDAATTLVKAVAECRNVVVAGPRGSGVAEVVSALAAELPKDEMTVAIESVPELDLDRSRTISITATDSGMSLGEAIEHGARLQAEHLVIHDLVGAHAVSALSAVLGREPGHVLGVYCWGGRDAMEGLLLTGASGGTERACVAQLVGSAIDLVVATQRGPEGPRVAAILEVQGYEAGDVSFQSVPF